MADINNPKRWRGESSKAYYWGKYIMKPGQIFTALEKDIPADFKNQIAQVSDTAPITSHPVTGQVIIHGLNVPLVEKKEKLIPNFLSSSLLSEKKEEITYHKKLREDGTYDVIDSKGKIINEKAQTKEEAAFLIKQLG